MKWEQLLKLKDSVAIKNCKSHYTYKIFGKVLQSNEDLIYTSCNFYKWILCIAETNVIYMIIYF